MTSIGFIEILIILILVLCAFDFKQIAQIIRWFYQVKQKFHQTKYSIEQELQQILIEEPQQKPLNDKANFRKWGFEQIKMVSQINMKERVEKVITHLKEQEQYQTSTHIGAFYGKNDEIETILILQQILNDNKKLYLPYCQGQNLFFAPIQNLYQDLATGNYNIKEPIKELQNIKDQPLEMLLIPGVVFDLEGNRIGRGKGFYDRYLDEHSIFKTGVCLDTQITTKKLPFESHDQKIDLLITEQRVLNFKKL